MLVLGLNSRIVIVSTLMIIMSVFILIIYLDNFEKPEFKITEEKCIDLYDYITLRPRECKELMFPINYFNISYNESLKDIEIDDKVICNNNHIHSISLNVSRELCGQFEINKMSFYDTQYCIKSISTNISIQNNSIKLKINATNNKTCIDTVDKISKYRYGYCLTNDEDEFEISIPDIKLPNNFCETKDFDIVDYEQIKTLDYSIYQQDLTTEWLDENCKCQSCFGTWDTMYDDYVTCDVSCSKYKCGDYNVEVKN